MACKLDRPDEVWLNKVGTFGVGCAPYFWGRLFGVVARVALILCLTAPVFQLVFADDLNWIAKGRRGWRYTGLALFVLTLFGSPVSWGKAGGGFEYEWVGYCLDLERHMLGITQKRADWLAAWADAVVQRKGVLVRDLVAVLGRMSFAAGPLERIRPSLSSLYAWSAVVPGGAYLSPPPAVLLCLRWVARRLRSEGRMAVCTERAGELGVLFRTDAQAEGTKVVVGGWRCAGGVRPAQAE